MPAASCCQVLYPIRLPLRLGGQAGSRGARGSLLILAKMKSSGSAASQLCACRWVTVLSWVLCKVNDATNCLGISWEKEVVHSRRSWTFAVYPFLFAICLGEGSTRDLLAKGKDPALPVVGRGQIVCPGHFRNSSFITRHNIPGGYLLAGRLSSWPSLTQQLPSGPILVCLSLCILRAPRWSGPCPYYCLCGSESPWMVSLRPPPLALCFTLHAP